MKLSVTILLFVALACVNGAYYTEIAYLSATSTCTGTATGGSALLIGAPTCSQNTTSSTYSTYTCFADNTVGILNCGTDATCAAANCVAGPNVTLCEADPDAPTTVFINRRCYTSAADVPVPPSNSFYVETTYSGSNCAAADGVTAIYFAPVNTCIPGEPEITQSTQSVCNATYASTSYYNGSACGGTPLETEVISGCVVGPGPSSVFARCAGAANGTTTASVAGSTSTHSTSGVLTTTGNNTHATTSGTGITSGTGPTHSTATTGPSSTTSDAAALSVSVLVAAIVILVAAF